VPITKLIRTINGEYLLVLDWVEERGGDIVTYYMKAYDLNMHKIENNKLLFRSFRYKFAVETDRRVYVNTFCPGFLASLHVNTELESELFYGKTREYKELERVNESYTLLPFMKEIANGDYHTGYAVIGALIKHDKINNLSDLRVAENSYWKNFVYYVDGYARLAIANNHILTFGYIEFSRTDQAVFAYRLSNMFYLGMDNYYYAIGLPKSVEIIAPEYLNSYTMPLDVFSAGRLGCFDCLMKINGTYATRYLTYTEEEAKKLKNRLFIKAVENEMTFLGPIYLAKPRPDMDTSDFDLNVKISIEDIDTSFHWANGVKGKMEDGKLYIHTFNPKYGGYTYYDVVHQLIPTGVKADNLEIRKDGNEVTFRLNNNIPRSRIQ